MQWTSSRSFSPPLPALADGGGHAVDDVSEDLLEAGQPVRHLPQPPVRDGALHVVASA